MTEAALLARVIHLCDLYGALVYHTHDSRGSRPGFPDLVIAGPLGILWRELKVVNGRLTFEQRQWGRGLREAGQDFEVWTPDDYASGRVGWEIAHLSELASLGQLPAPPAMQLRLDDAA
jgi:hypothetical protein